MKLAIIVLAISVYISGCTPAYRPSSCLIDYRVARESGVNVEEAFDDYVTCREEENHD